MKAFIAFIFVAIIGLGVMTIAALDSGITGQGVKLTIPPATLKKTMEVAEKVSESQKDGYNCQNPYANSVITDQEGKSFIGGLSRMDCEIVKDIQDLRIQVGKEKKYILMEGACRNRGWWPDE